MSGWRELWHVDFSGQRARRLTLAFVTLLVTFHGAAAGQALHQRSRRRLIVPGPPRVHCHRPRRTPLVRLDQKRSARGWQCTRGGRGR